MTAKPIGATAIALLLAAAATPQAQAQTRRGAAARPAAATATAAKPTTPALPPLNHGPPIAGVCIFSNGAAIGSSTVGKAFQARMQQIRAQAAAEISAEENSLRTDAQAFQSKRASLTQDQIQQQGQPLVQREQALRQKANQRQDELEYTARFQIDRINRAMEPLVQNSYQQHRCSLLLGGDAVLAANPAMDLTPEVVQQLNARMSTITFDRMAVPASAQPRS